MCPVQSMDSGRVLNPIASMHWTRSTAARSHLLLGGRHRGPPLSAVLGRRNPILDAVSHLVTTMLHSRYSPGLVTALAAGHRGRAVWDGQVKGGATAYAFPPRSTVQRVICGKGGRPLFQAAPTMSESRSSRPGIICEWVTLESRHC